MKTEVRAHEIATLLDDAPAGIRCLSLDCFDTLLWRNAQAPRDVFADLPLVGGGIEPRVNVEGRVRAARLAAHGTIEVTIEEIYDCLMPGATSEERQGAVAYELDAEARHCFAFAPVVALMRTAKAKGLQVIVVSDTYLSHGQLRTLIARAAGDDVATMIDRVFCSSEYRMSKAKGLFGPVLEALALPPSAIVHLGDNHAADSVAPCALGMHGVHFEQFETVTEQRLRLEAAAATLIHPTIRLTQPARQPHRPQISLRAHSSPIDHLGHDVLGPVMHSFASWIREEADMLAANSGRPVKILFLMRDGYLPHEAFKAGGFGTGVAVEISRFTAMASSFTDEAAIRSYLVGETTEEIDILGRQLLLSAIETRQIGRTCDDFREKILKPSAVRMVCERSRAFAKRLVAHVVREAKVAPGDALMLVDLGYNGSVQNLVAPLLAAELDVQVAGRYLLLREQLPSGLDKKGMIDVRHYEARLVDALCGSVAVFEQLCTVAQGSVVDYQPDGGSIRKSPGAKGVQSGMRSAIQSACLDFVRDAGKGTHRPPVSDDGECRRQSAAATMARLFSFPMREEIELLEQFDHDINLGTQGTIKLINDSASGDQLRRRGLPYISAADRMYLPGEVQRHGLPLALSLSLVGRFGLDMRHSDFQVGGIDVPVLIADARGQTVIAARAHPTHDGYYLLTVPAGAFAIGVQLGAIAEVVQIEEVAFYPVDDFSEYGCKPAAPATPLYDAMETIAPGLHRCRDSGLIFVPPPVVKFEEPILLAIVFRPVVRRAVANVAILSEAA